MVTRGKMALAVIPKGSPFSWRSPGAHAEGDLDFEHYKQVARIVERGKFDAIFLADSLSIREDRIGLEGIAGFGTALYFDALTMLGALAAVTHDVGLVATASTTYHEPYHLARAFASVDHISHGRAGWNVITSGQDSEAFNFGLREQRSTDERYARAAEFLDVVFDLWDSWEDGAIVREPEAQRFFDPQFVHRLDHAGTHFAVRGPLNLSRSPQGRPLICQAGASEAGWEMAARTADVLFAQALSLPEAQRLYAGIKARLARYGRHPDDLKVLLGLVPVVGTSDAEARAKFRAVQDCMTEAEGKGMLAQYVPGVDFSAYAIDEPIPNLAEIDRAAQRFRIALDIDGRRMTLRELLDLVSAGVGTMTLVGSAGHVADVMTTWFLERGADGFNLSPHVLPSGLEDFVELVVPELQSRGVFRTEYEGSTLRENLGLARPANRFRARGSQAR